MDQTRDDWPVFRAFVHFSITPKPLLQRFRDQSPEPVPVTIREFAEQHEVSSRTLFRWKKTDAFEDAMQAALEEFGETPLPTAVGNALRSSEE